MLGKSFWGLAMHASLETFVANCESVIAGIEGRRTA
jgi:hypothetical protein